MVKLQVNEKSFDIKNSRIVIEGQKITVGDKVELAGLEGTQVQLSVRPDKVVIRTKDKSKELSSEVETSLKEIFRDNIDAIRLHEEEIKNYAKNKKAQQT